MQPFKDILKHKRPTIQAEETYLSSKRDLLSKQKSDKETYYLSKRNLLLKQKKPTIEAKEIYYRSKRDPLSKPPKPTIGSAESARPFEGLGLRG